MAEWSPNSFSYFFIVALVRLATSLALSLNFYNHHNHTAVKIKMAASSLERRADLDLVRQVARAEGHRCKQRECRDHRNDGWRH